MSTFILYLISILDSIIVASIIVSIVLGILAIVFICIRAESYKEEDQQYFIRKSKICAVFCAVFILFSVITPSTDSMLALYGYKNLYDFVQNNEKVQELPEKIIDITDKYIEYLDKELQNECTEK